MGEYLKLTSSDGHEFEIYEAMPEAEARASIVVIQEIFGVNGHIREVADGYAAAGYRALAPALFDRVEQRIELGYAGADMMQGVEIARGKLNPQETLMDIQATVIEAAKSGPVGVVGYCFGGLMSFLSACHLDGIACAVSYYGGGVSGQLDASPKVPIQFHFAELDAHIPMSDVEKVRAAFPDSALFTYNADHGFNCDHRASYDQAAADEARGRALEFFAEHL